MRILSCLAAITFAGIALAGCSQPRPKPILGCNYQTIQLTVGPQWKEAGLRVNAASAALEGVSNDPVNARLGAVLTARRARKADLLGSAPGTPPAAQPDQFLALSGGGQHGAFGSGFFYGIGQLPTWDIVTGVSTGSLQSTLLFLANQPVPADRTYGWVNGPLSGQDGATGFVVKPGMSNIGDMVLAYSIASEADLMRIRFGGAAMGAVLKGSSASFGPLRDRLLKIMTIGTLQAVGEQWTQNQRQLFVGVSSLDDGQGYGIDMTELAARTLPERHPTPQDLKRIQGCYVDALLASASVPPGVPPVTLQTATSTNMYMDGGARFGVFLEPVTRALRGAGAAGDAQVTLMVNTTLSVGSWSSDGQPMQKWSAISAALRAVNLMETQVYNFSVASVEELGIAKGWLRMAYLSNDDIPGGEQPDDHMFDGKTCAQWQAIDAKAKPMQFYPWYMACTADYGRSRGVAQQWNHSVTRTQ
jgi:Patatin-like phospholipase